jgi:hypothetical protein
MENARVQVTYKNRQLWWAYSVHVSAHDESCQRIIFIHHFVYVYSTLAVLTLTLLVQASHLNAQCHLQTPHKNQMD